MGSLRLWLRWSWRDLRSRWLLVAAISMIVAIGTGVYGGLSSTAKWRRISYDASYEALAAHDLRVTAAEGTYVEPERLLAAIDALPDDLGIAAAEPRLYADIQVDASVASKASDTILVPGQVVGVDVAAGGPAVDSIWVARGRGLRPGDEGERRVVLDHHFAKHYELPDAGKLRVTGDVEVEYVGQGFTPEYFWVTTDEGSLLAEAGFAVMFAPLGTAQELAGKPGLVNDLFVDLAGHPTRRELDQAAERVEKALGDALPDVALEVTTLEDDRVRRMLYDDIEGDQRLYNIFAVIILGGAAFAAFNLVGRVVEAQRREIGIGMALGVPRLRIAIRPLLVGFQVAALGALLGIGVGLLIGRLLDQIMRDYVPLPVWRTPFQSGTYAIGAALGLALPFVATILPVWRAVRVDPIDAIRTGPTVAKRSGLAPLARRFAIGTSLTQMPIRNVLRAPRRTLLTTFAIGAAISTLVAVIGMVDSFFDTIDRGDREILGDAPRRLTIDLAGEYAGFTVAGSETLTRLEHSPVVERLEPSLRLPGRLSNGGEPVDVLVTLHDLDSPLWRPTAAQGSLTSDDPGVVIAEKAADDLGVGVSDTVTLRHPRREGLTGFSWVESRLPVIAIHPNPYRFLVFMDDEDASLMDLAGVYNAAVVDPPPGVSAEEVQRELFDLEGVASVESVAAVVDTIRESIGEALGILNVVDGAVLFLALLIAFNSSSISADERAREYATMFAFGLPPRVVLLMAVAESLVIGLLGTLLGMALGVALLGWIVHFLLPTTMPDLGVHVAVSTSTLVTAAVLGTVAVAVAPIFTLRRMRRMDIPATLRVVE